MAGITNLYFSKTNSSGHKSVLFLLFVGHLIAYRKNREYVCSPNGHQVYILPFGAIEIYEKNKIASTGLTRINVNGFSEVYYSGMAEVQLDTGHHFKVAS